MDFSLHVSHSELLLVRDGVWQTLDQATSVIGGFGGAGKRSSADFMNDFLNRAIQKDIKMSFNEYLLIVVEHITIIIFRKIKYKHQIWLAHSIGTIHF